MPNYLSVDNGGSEEIDSGFPGPAAVTTGPVDNGLGAGFSGNVGGVSFSLGGGFGSGGGSKPMALHTEFAESSAEWAKPYGSSTDVVFYLMRADQA